MKQNKLGRGNVKLIDGYCLELMYIAEENVRKSLMKSLEQGFRYRTS